MYVCLFFSLVGGGLIDWLVYSFVYFFSQCQKSYKLGLFKDKNSQSSLRPFMGHRVDVTCDMSSCLELTFYTRSISRFVISDFNTCQVMMTVDDSRAELAAESGE